jgi:catechol 2,3-dioxygenase-like lactoylglutathione lyase family enzyme
LTACPALYLAFHASPHDRLAPRPRVRGRESGQLPCPLDGPDHLDPSGQGRIEGIRTEANSARPDAHREARDAPCPLSPPMRALKVSAAVPCAASIAQAVRTVGIRIHDPAFGFRSLALLRGPGLPLAFGLDETTRYGASGFWNPRHVSHSLLTAPAATAIDIRRIALSHEKRFHRGCREWAILRPRLVTPFVLPM